MIYQLNLSFYILKNQNYFYHFLTNSSYQLFVKTFIFQHIPLFRSISLTHFKSAIEQTFYEKASEKT